MEHTVRGDGAHPAWLHFSEQAHSRLLLLMRDTVESIKTE